MSLPSSDVQSRLLAAIKANNLELVKFLIENEKADPSAVKIYEDENDETSTFMYPLLFLATQEPAEEEQQQAQQQQSKKQHRKEGTIPITPLLDYLISSVPGMEDRPDPDGATLLFYACCAGTARLVDRLLSGPSAVSKCAVTAETKYKENGLDDNLSDKTPLAVAVERGDDEALEIAKILLRSGAERKPPAAHVLSALHLAVESDAKRPAASFPFLTLLLDAGWSISTPGRTVWAPQGESDFDKSLLAQACFVDQYEDLGRAKEMIKFLLSRGARWDAQLDLAGFTRYAAASGNSAGAVRPFALPIAFAQQGDADLKQALLKAGCPDMVRPPRPQRNGDDDSDHGEFEECEEDGFDEDEASDSSDHDDNNNVASGAAAAAATGAVRRQRQDE